MPDPDSDQSLAPADKELSRWHEERRRRYSRFTLSILSSIPWVGGFLSASANLQAETDQGQINELLRLWLREHQEKLRLLGRDITEIIDRLDQIGAATSERIEDPSYLGLVGQGFRVWDRATTEEKRNLVKKLLSNAAGTTLCSDDVVRLFIDWIEEYHEAHFAVIREIYGNPGTTRAVIWNHVYGRPVREDSAEADLFKLLVRDLSTGGVIRQHRETTYDGQFLKRQRSSSSDGGVMKSAFDDAEPYVLTGLGKQFVHYAMTDVVPRLGAADSQPPEEGAG